MLSNILAKHYASKGCGNCGTRHQLSSRGISLMRGDKSVDTIYSARCSYCGFESTFRYTRWGALKALSKGIGPYGDDFKILKMLGEIK